MCASKLFDVCVAAAYSCVCTDAEGPNEPVFDAEPAAACSLIAITVLSESLTSLILLKQSAFECQYPCAAVNAVPFLLYHYCYSTKLSPAGVSDLLHSYHA